MAKRMDVDERLIEYILQDVEEGLILADLNGDILRVNGQAESILGWKEVSLKDRPKNLFSLGILKRQEELDLLHRGGKILNAPLDAEKWGGKGSDLLFSAIPLTSAQGDVREIAVILKSSPKREISAEESWREWGRFFVAQITENLQEAVFYIDNRGRLIFANQAFARIMEMDLEGLIGKPLTSIIRPVGRPLLFQNVVETSIRKGYWQGETEVEVGGKRKVLSITTALIKSEKGENLGIAFVVRDATQVKLMEEGLKRREFELSLIYGLLSLPTRFEDLKEALRETLSEILIILRSEAGSVLLWDGESESLKVQSAIGFTYRGVRELEEEAKKNRPLYKVYRSGEPWWVSDIKTLRRRPILQGKRGELHSLLAVPIASSTKSMGVVVVANRQKTVYEEEDVRMLSSLASQLSVIIELAELVQVLEAKVDELGREREFTRAIIENIPSALFLLDRQGKIEFINERCREILGWEKKDVIGRTFFNLLSPDGRDRVKRETSSLTTTQTVFMEARMLNRDRREVEVEISFTPRPFEEGKFRGLLVVVNDLTERRKREQLERERETEVKELSRELAGAHRAIERLNIKQWAYLSMVHHELVPPLNLLKEDVRELSRDRESMDQEEMEERVELISRRVKRIERLVSDLRDISRVELGELELKKKWVNLSELTTRAMTEMSLTAPNHVIRLRLTGEEIYGKVDSDRVEQVLFNLMENAVKFSPEGSEIILSLDKVGENLAEWKVEDKGMGMTKEQLRKAFREIRLEEFVDVPQLGLGLFICNHIVTAHGGEMHMESAKGKGTTISFTIPLEG